MKDKITLIRYAAAMIAAILIVSCTEEEHTPLRNGAPLSLTAMFAPSTRLAELPNPNEMAVNKDGKGLYNVGVYVYYTEDYDRGDLSKPYVRNREFTVRNNQLYAVIEPGEDPSDEMIYIYDEMTIVAFYPYNATMSQPENFFTVKADEEKYPITRNEYSNQYYIPYRAETNTDPSIAYYTTLTFVPKHTYKVEIVVVGQDGTTLPTPGTTQVLPLTDPLTTPDTLVDGRREEWYDFVNQHTNDGSGSNVQQYITYIWTREGNRNDIKRGDLLLQSDALTLIASQDLYPNEQHVYRYGYNMSTGEIFIPTSSNLIYDASSLSSINNGSSSNYYQVCDIDLGQAGNWTPLSIYNSRYDGGGHQLTDMTINSTDKEVGLFGQIQGNSVVANVNLVNPVITVNSDSAYVGGLVGRLNTPMTEAEKQSLIGGLPPGLSEIVREELIKEILANAGSSQANVVGSKVQNPVITVNGVAPIVGSFAGQAGEKNDAGNSKSRIWDSATIGGTLTVNSGAPQNNQNSYVGGFIGLNQGYVTRSYTTTSNINAQVNGTDAGGNPILVDNYTGFATMGADFTPDEGGIIENSYSQLADNNSGVTQFSQGWPSWNTYTADWPVDITGWFNDPSSTFWYSNGTAPSTYPSLQWERR